MLETWRWWILGFFLLTVAVEYVLEYLNRKHLERYGMVVPEGFEAVVQTELLAKTQAYTLAKMKFANVVALFNAASVVVFFYSGLWDAYNVWMSFPALPFVVQGIFYFLGLVILTTMIGLPLGWYQTFRLEQRFGFNTMTPWLWVTDTIKSLVLSSVLMGVLLGGGLILIQRFPETWWLWVWVFFFVFSLIMLLLSPYVIEPLFNKFKPVEQPELVEAIRDLMAKAGLRVSRVFESDASKRSKHTNAYFTGIGPVKRIVLFDTLLQQTAPRELLAVLAHEVGHWKKKHILQRLVITEIVALGVCYAAFWGLRASWISDIFHLHHGSFYAHVVGLLFIGSVLAFFFEPISCYFSRKHEREADAFAAEITRDPDALADALIRLFKDNLSNLHPHPWYAAFHYSHPPLVERIRTLRTFMSRQKGNA